MADVEKFNRIAGVLANNNQATFQIFGYSYGDAFIVLNFDDGDIIVKVTYEGKEVIWSKLIPRDRLESVKDFAKKEKAVEELFEKNQE